MPNYIHSNTLCLDNVPKKGITYWSPACLPGIKFKFTEDKVYTILYQVQNYLGQGKSMGESLFDFTLPGESWENLVITSTNKRDSTTHTYITTMLQKYYGGNSVTLNSSNKVITVFGSKLSYAALEGDPRLSWEYLKKEGSARQAIFWRAGRNSAFWFFLDTRHNDHINLVLINTTAGLQAAFSSIDLDQEGKSGNTLLRKRIPVDYGSDHISKVLPTLMKLKKQINKLLRQSGIESVCTWDRAAKTLVLREYKRCKPIKASDYPNIQNFSQFDTCLRHGSLAGTGATESEVEVFNRLQTKLREKDALSLRSWKKAYALYTELCARIRQTPMQLTLNDRYEDLIQYGDRLTMLPEISPIEEMWAEIINNKKGNKMEKYYKPVKGSSAEFLLRKEKFFEFFYFEDNKGTALHRQLIELYEKEGKLSLDNWRLLLKTYRENVAALNLSGVQIGQWKKVHEELQFNTIDPNELELVPDFVDKKSVKKIIEENKGMPIGDSPVKLSAKQEALEREHMKALTDLQKKEAEVKAAEQKRLDKIEEERKKKQEEYEKNTRIATLTEELTALKGVKKNPLQLAGSPQGAGFLVLFFACLATLFQMFKPKPRKKKKRPRPEYVQQISRETAEKVVEKEKILVEEYA